MKTSDKPSYQAQKRRMKARSRAFHRLAALHRPDFLRLLDEEQRIVDAETAAVAAEPVRPVIREAAALDDPALRYAGLPLSAPRGWLQDFDDREAG